LDQLGERGNDWVQEITQAFVGQGDFGFEHASLKRPEESRLLQLPSVAPPASPRDVDAAAVPGTGVARDFLAAPRNWRIRKQAVFRLAKSPEASQ